MCDLPSNDSDAETTQQRRYYLDDNLNQTTLLSVDYLEVLGENTVEFCLYTLMTHTLDLEEFDKGYKNQRVGLVMFSL